MDLEYNDYVKNLRDDDILEQNDKVFKFDQVKKTLQTAFDSVIPSALINHNTSQKVDIYARSQNHWFSEGVDCRILKAGSNGWQKGKLKLKVTIEFIPDEPEIPEYQSPLDEIRREMQQNS
jgi:hypothetical protein